MRGGDIIVSVGGGSAFGRVVGVMVKVGSSCRLFICVTSSICLYGMRGADWYAGWSFCWLGGSVDRK